MAPSTAQLRHRSSLLPLRLQPSTVQLPWTGQRLPNNMPPQGVWQMVWQSANVCKVSDLLTLSDLTELNSALRLSVSGPDTLPQPWRTQQPVSLTLLHRGARGLGVMKSEENGRNHKKSTNSTADRIFEDRKPTREVWLLWRMDGRANPLMDRKLVKLSLSLSLSPSLCVSLSLPLSIFLFIYLSFVRSVVVVVGVSKCGCGVV